jgi:hypothetical protein
VELLPDNHQAVQKRSWFDKLTMTSFFVILSLPKGNSLLC